MNSEVVAERKLLLLDTTSATRSELLIEIHRPRWTEGESQAVCSVSVRGLTRAPVDIFGVDLINAIECAMSFTESLLRNLPKNQIVTWSNGDCYFDQ